MSRDIQALVLAGGRGSRMAERLPQLPKPLMEVGGMALVMTMLAKTGIQSGYRYVQFEFLITNPSL